MGDRRTKEIVLMNGTFTGDGNGDAKLVEYYNEAQIFIKTSTFNGNTLDYTLQCCETDSDDDGDWADHPNVTVTQISGTGIVMYTVSNLGKYTRIKREFDGTTMTGYVKLVCKN